jgi:ribonuclease Z
VYGPDGVGEVVSGFNLAYRLDALYRTAHHGEVVAPPSGAGMTAMPFPTPALGASTVLWERDGAKVIAFRVEHDPADPAVGYRFEYGGRSAVVSGDTHKSANLASFAKDADLLAHEALSHELVAVLQRAATAAGRPNVAKIAADIPSYHTSPVEAAELATEAGVRHLLLYHVLPPLPVAGLEAAFVEGVDDAYSGPVTLGRDGTIVSMPSGSKSIDTGSRM